MRLSVTNLDAYRRYCRDEDVTLESLLAQLRRETPPTPAMMAGRAFHAALENLRDDADVIDQDDHRFRFQIDSALYLPPIRELKGEVVLPTSVGDVTLVGIVDGLHGTEVYDHKLSASFDAERYANSYQWRCYLTMFGGEKFTYNVFVGKVDDSGDWVIYDLHRLPFYAYPAMRGDVLKAVDEFAQFWRSHMEQPALELVTQA